MTVDPMWMWIAAVAVAVLAVVGLIMRGSRRSRTEALRDKFGSEYDHALSEHGSRTRAERELLDRAEQVRGYTIVPLSASDRDRFRNDWKRVEQRFVERPTTAVVEADEIVADIMRRRGYPMGDFDRHAADLSVTHPNIVAHYRAGHRVITESPGTASTEDMRQAMLRYRALFDELIDDRIGNDVVSDVPSAVEVEAAPRTQVRSREEEVRPPSSDTSR
jgi:hypothetical protein